MRSTYRSRADAPRQGRLAETISEIIIFDAYREGIRDLANHRFLFVLTWLHEADRGVLEATPPTERRPHGVFATRSPDRPNPIGLCLVKLLEIEGAVLRVQWLDAIDGTPVLDIKPFHRRLDCPEDEGRQNSM
jgi:tRNA-Thr(GGU) m(6)t(6)A37 methyltransferase TsaA